MYNKLFVTQQWIHVHLAHTTGRTYGAQLLWLCRCKRTPVSSTSSVPETAVRVHPLYQSICCSHWHRLLILMVPLQSVVLWLNNIYSVSIVVPELLLLPAAALFGGREEPKMRDCLYLSAQCCYTFHVQVNSWHTLAAPAAISAAALCCYQTAAALLLLPRTPPRQHDSIAFICFVIKLICPVKSKFNPSLRARLHRCSWSVPRLLMLLPVVAPAAASRWAAAFMTLMTMDAIMSFCPCRPCFRQCHNAETEI